MTVTEPAPIPDLVERAGRLTGPDREVDKLVHEIAAGECVHRRRHREALDNDDFDLVCSDCGYDGYAPPPSYTTSVDAVLGLVERKLPHQLPALLKQPQGHWAANLYRLGYEIERHGPTPALAMLKALLAALTTQEP